MSGDQSDSATALFPDLYADLHNIADMFYTPGHAKRKGIKDRTELQIITQNLQGFTKKRREAWFRGWKQRTDVRHADIIFVQDTHLKTIAEVSEITAMWNHIWGVKDPPKPLSYWTTTATRSGGVGILLQPRIAGRIQPWKESGWTDRRIAVQFDSWRLVNVYAPPNRCKQQVFFTDLQDWMEPDESTLVGGDFNAVLNPCQDRLVNGQPRLTPCESKELSQLVDTLDLLDAVTLNAHANEDNIPDPLTHYTYWRKRSASRIDRFYLSSDIAGKAQWVEARDPACHSDHQELRLWLLVQNSPIRKRKRMTRYPFSSSRPEWVRTQIQKRITKMVAAFQRQSCPAAAWDTFAKQLSLMIGEVARVDREHTEHYYDRLQVNLRSPPSTRAEIQREVQHRRVRQRNKSFGRSLQPTTANLKSFYKKHANWQRDQHVTTIDPSPGHFYPDSMPTAERMASEWNDILGASHAKVSPDEVREALKRFHEVPAQNRLKPEEQVELMKPITKEEVIAAIDQLPRDKSGGSSGLSHDFCKDFKEELAGSLAAVYQAIQNGAAVPKSFLDAVVVPLRKKGDSSNAMDYRPISLLNTAYKILGRIYASRIHPYLPRLISGGQQGFVRGRLLTRSVTMVQALLQSLFDDPEIDWKDSPAILSIDLRKAYDTLCRNFMAAALDQYGFPQQFLDVFHSLHNGTMASYLVNGEESTKWSVNSGIRQGCPLAPLLFVLAVDFLGRAIQAHPDIKGLKIPGSGGKRHAFNGFVDDSTVFVSATRELESVNTILKRFGELSGLQVQPSKSVLIPLNMAWKQSKCHGYPVLAHTDTTRILGYHIGVKDTTVHNWEIRVQNIKKRLQVAAQVTNSVNERVILFNTVVLPAILFTGQHIPITPEALRQLEQLQKQFIWRGTIAEENTRHKLAPGLVFAPVEQGGLGLTNIETALQITRMNQAEYWMQCSPDNYSAAWHSLSHSNQMYSPDCCIFTPTTTNQIRSCRRKRRDGTRATVQELGRLELWADQTDRLKLQPPPGTTDRVIHAKDTLICYWHHSGALQCALPSPTPGEPDAESVDFLRSSNWSNNACIVDRNGKPLRARDFPLLYPCSLLQLQVASIGPGEFILLLPIATRPFKLQHHRQIRRWCASVFASVPEKVWTQVSTPVNPWYLPTLKKEYQWITSWYHQVTAFAITAPRGEAFQLNQNADGWTWRVTGRNADESFDDDFVALQHTEKTTGIAFEATPFLYTTPWVAPPKTIARNLRQMIRKARAKRLHRKPKFSIQHILNRMKDAAEGHPWIEAAQRQSPKQIWKRDGILTDYQRWTIYRICTRTLNLYHGGWPNNRKCSYGQCTTSPETIEHIVWACKRAQCVWRYWIPSWLGHHPTQYEMNQLLTFTATRAAPSITPDFRSAAANVIPEWSHELNEAMQTLWRIWTTCTQCMLWRIRNKEIFENVHIHQKEAETLVWRAADFQTTAVVRAWTSNAATYEQGFRLAQCYSVFKEVPPLESSLFLQTWIVQIHVTKNSNECSGAWILLRPSQVNEVEIEAIGIHVKQASSETRAWVQEVLESATKTLRQITIPSTVHVLIQGAVPVKQRPQGPASFEQFNSYTWETTKVQEVSGAAKLIKMSRSGSATPGIFAGRPHSHSRDESFARSAK